MSIRSILTIMALACTLGVHPAAILQAQQAKCSSLKTWHESSLKDIQPQGWLKEKLVTQKEGLTGHPEALSYPYNTCLWAGEIPRMGTHGQDWWRYEQTAYYTDGLLRLGYLLDDEQLIEKGEEGINYTLNHPQPNGRLGSKQVEYTWPFAVFFRAVKAEYDTKPDKRTLETLKNHYRSIPLSQLVRKRDILSLEGMIWTASQTGDKALLARADSAFRYRKELLKGVKLSRDDRVTPGFLRDTRPYKMHGVTMSEILKLPIMLYAATGDKWYRHIGEGSLRHLYEENGLPDGLFTSAEWLQGPEIRHSHETCNAVDMSWTLGYYLEVLKDPRYADLLEKIVFNAGAGSVTQDFKALQYYSSVNQFIATGTSNHNKDNYCSTWMAYRPTHQTECCAGNIHRLYPDYAARMWLRGEGDGKGDGEAIAALYGPSTFRYSDNLTFEEQTEYPYGQTVTITAKVKGCKRKAKLTLRIPCWCDSATLTVNGKPSVLPLEKGTFVTLDRKWGNGDKLVLTLPMKTERQTAYGGGIYYERGPLVYCYSIPSISQKDTTRYANMNGKYPADDNAFPCWDIRPNKPWNYAVTEDAMPEETSNALRLKVRPIDWTWDKGPKGELLTPDLPDTVEPTGPEEYIELIPYGQTTLRLTVFPVIKQQQKKEPTVACELKYRPDGKFKILQLADTHYIDGDPRSERALNNVIAVLDAEKPDFVIHTGDIIYGEPAAASAKAILQPLVDRGIPFAVTLGNHDNDFDLSRAYIYKLVRSIPGNVNTPDDPNMTGCSTDIITLSGDNGPDRIFYLFDSGNRDFPAGVKSWGYVHSDQIDWYRKASAYFTRRNGGTPVPSLAFFHIPLPEIDQALRDEKSRRTGNAGEKPCPPLFNSGLYLTMREMADVQGIVTGHDHNNDYVLLWQGFYFIYGRFSGCDTVYNDLHPSGARVFEFTSGDEGFRTWVRLSDGRIEQELYLKPGQKELPAK